MCGRVNRRKEEREGQWPPSNPGQRVMRQGQRVSCAEGWLAEQISHLSSKACVAGALAELFLATRSSSPPPLPSQVRKPAGAGQPWLPATRALAGLRAFSSCPTPIPQSQLSETNPEAARKGKSGRRWGPAAGPGVPAPALSCSPTGSSQTGRALSLCLPRSLERSLRPGYLGGLQDGTAREGSLCAAPRE